MGFCLDEAVSDEYHRVLSRVPGVVGEMILRIAIVGGCPVF